MSKDKELIDYKHKLKMKELEYSRETDRIKKEGLLDLEKQKHRWKLEEGRIYIAEQRKLIQLKDRIFSHR